MKIVFAFLMLILSFSSGKKEKEYCIYKDTYGAYNKYDMDKLIQYATDNEVKLIKMMIDKKRIVSLKKGTKVIVVMSGGTTIVHLPDNEQKIWVLSDTVVDCREVD